MVEAVKKAQTTLSQNLGGAAHQHAPDGAKFSLDDVPDQSSKVAVVTGGAQGIGYGVVHTLLSKNIAKVFILSMSKDVIDDSIASIKEEMGEDKANRMKWLHCDMSDYERVTEVASQIRDETDRLDILVNNAARGIMTYQLDNNGLDRHMSVNLFGHVVLTSHLLPLLKKTAESGQTVRISNQASNAHQNSPGDTKFESIDDINQDLGPMGQYGRSKLAKILYSRYLNKHLHAEYPRILINATHPGVVETKMSKEDIHEPYPKAGYVMSTVMSPFKKDQFEGAVSTMYAATTTECSGEYVCPPADAESGSDLAQSEELAEKLMKLTREIITEKTKKDSVDKGCPMKDY